MQGSGPHGLLVTLYFDKKTNLLLRMVRYSKSPVGRIPTQVDYADYRDVGGVKFPFSYTFSWLDGKDAYKLSDVKVNVPIDASRLRQTVVGIGFGGALAVSPVLFDIDPLRQLLSAQEVLAPGGSPRSKPGLEAKDKAKPAPRLPDGKVDLGGKGVWAPIWVLDWADTKYVDKAIDVPFTPQGLKLYQERKANLSKDEPEGYCLPPAIPRCYTGNAVSVSDHSAP